MHSLQKLLLASILPIYLQLEVDRNEKDMFRPTTSTCSSAGASQLENGWCRCNDGDKSTIIFYNYTQDLYCQSTSFLDCNIVLGERIFLIEDGIFNVETSLGEDCILSDVVAWNYNSETKGEWERVWEHVSSNFVLNQSHFSVCGFNHSMWAGHLMKVQVQCGETVSCVALKVRGALKYPMDSQDAFGRSPSICDPYPKTTTTTTTTSAPTTTTLMTTPPTTQPTTTYSTTTRKASKGISRNNLQAVFGIVGGVVVIGLVSGAYYVRYGRHDALHAVTPKRKVDRMQRMHNSMA